MSNVISDENLVELDCLLINPPDSFSRYPYLGLCSLAGELESQNIKVGILDCAALGITANQDILTHIVSRKPKIIGISVMSMMLKQCFEIVNLIKLHCPGATLVVGGAHINADPEILIPMGVKYGFHGECERGFAEFCARILGNQEINNIPGLIINNGNAAIYDAPPLIDDLDALPLPAYHLLPIDKYFSPNTNSKVISVITSRGCPYDCVFCSKLNRIKHRRLSPKRVVEQLGILLHTHGIEWVEFVDEIFTINRQWVVELCQEILNSGLKFEWGAGTRADCIDEDMIVLMKKAGCRKVGFGAETGSERVRFLDRKLITNDQLITAVKLCNRHGMYTMASYIFGHPTETEKEMMETVQFSKKLPTHTAFFNKMIPIPGSELFDSAVKSGAVAADIWTSFMLGKCPYPIYYPTSTRAQKVDQIYRRAWLQWYLSPRSIYRNLGKLLKPVHLMKSLKAFLLSSSDRRYQK